MEIGEPVRRWEVVPLSEPIPADPKPAAIPVKEPVPEKEKEPA